MNGGYLGMQIRQWIIRPIIAFREYAFSDILTSFTNLNERAGCPRSGLSDLGDHKPQPAFF
jgi:hypothetical protein